MAEAEEAWRKAKEEDAWRVSETSGEPLHSRIVGYGKGRVPERCVCTNCLRKGIEWDEGG